MGEAKWLLVTMFWEILIDRLDKADCHKREKDQKKKKTKTKQQI